MWGHVCSRRRIGLVCEVVARGLGAGLAKTVCSVWMHPYLHLTILLSASGE